MSFPPPPQQPPQPPPQQPPQPQPAPNNPGLFGALFDVSFRHFATPHIARIVYILVMIAIAVAAIGGLITAFGLMASRQPARVSSCLSSPRWAHCFTWRSRG